MGSHQRFFRSLCISSKVETAISHAQQAIDEGHCVVIGLQSTGEARAKDAAKNLCRDEGGDEEDGLLLDEFLSASKEGIKKVSRPSPLITVECCLQCE